MLELIAVLSVMLAPPQWIDGGLDNAMTRASKNKVVLVDVYADWCSPCNQLAMEVLDAKAGQKLLKKAIGVKVDFDSTEGRKVTEKYGVISLPTTLVLDSNGTELGRVEGYPGRKEYVDSVLETIQGRVSVDALKKQLDATPGDLDLMVTYAQARLVRGDSAAALPLLRKAIDKGGSVGARAARIWGRWLIRVKRDASQGTAHFLKMMQLYKGTKYAKGFLYWAASGHYLQNEKEKALTLFDTWIVNDPVSEDAYKYKANFMVNKGYDLKRTSLVILAGLGLADGDAWLHYLHAVVLYRQRQYPEAKQAVERAISRESKKAIFRNLKHRISLAEGKIPMDDSRR